MLMLLAPLLVEFALQFRSCRLFLADVHGLDHGCCDCRKLRRQGRFATCLGLGISTIGIDLQTGATRLTLGIEHLYSGIGVVVGGIGLYAIGEALWVAAGGGGPRL